MNSHAAAVQPMVTAGSNFTVALRSDGTVAGDQGWGKVVEDWADIIQVDAHYGTIIGLKKDGTVVAVGSNSSGQLQVDGWSDIVQVAAGCYHTMGLKQDGTIHFP